MTPDERDDDLFKPDSALGLDGAGALPPSVWAQKPPAVGAAAPVPIGQLLAEVQSIKTDDDTPPIAPAVTPAAPPPAPMPAPVRALQPKPQAMGFGPGMDANAINAAFDNARKRRDNADWLDVANGFSLTGGNKALSQNLHASADDDFKRVQALQKSAQDNFKYGREQRQANKDDEMDDPASKTSALARNLTTRALPNAAQQLPDFENYSASQLYTSLPLMKEIFDRELAKSIAESKTTAGVEEKKVEIGAKAEESEKDRAFKAEEKERDRKFQEALVKTKNPEEWMHMQDKNGNLFLYNPRTAEVRQVDTPKAPAAAPGTVSKDAEKSFQAMQHDMNGTGARSGELGANQRRINGAGRLEKLARDSNGDVNNLTPQQMQELATGLQALITTGGHSTTEIEHLKPESYVGHMQDFLQKLTNTPRGADQQAFTKNILDTIAREKQASVDSNTEMRTSLLPNYAHLRKADKARFDSMLKGFGVDPATIDDNGLAVTPSKGAGDTSAAPAPSSAPGAGWTRGKVKGRTGWVSPDKTQFKKDP